ncbi:MAG: hypothetical protein R3E79_19825 [Caldilineaceae bacterium]
MIQSIVQQPEGQGAKPSLSAASAASHSLLATHHLLRPDLAVVAELIPTGIKLLIWAVVTASCCTILSIPKG